MKFCNKNFLFLKVELDSNLRQVGCKFQVTNSYLFSEQFPDLLVHSDGFKGFWR